MLLRLLQALFVAAFLLVLGLGGFYLWAMRAFDEPGPLTSEKTLVIPRGAGLATIAQQLESEGVVENGLLFRFSVTILDKSRSLRAGEYRFAPGISGKEVMALLESGRVVVRRLTIPEGLTSAEIVELVEQAEALTGSVEMVPPEGSLLPETYHYERDENRVALIERMRGAMNEALEELWPGRAPDLPIDSPQEAVILASIVEKETGVPEERPLVASVFVNRLEIGMRLQSDPTVAYALTEGAAPLDRPLTRADLKLENPYNTYVNAGLPPGPIANPGRAALEAVLNPADTKYLYFVADGSGGHAFGRNLEEHNRNVAEWRRLQRSKQEEPGG